MIGYCINLINKEYKFEETKKELSNVNIDVIRFGVTYDIKPMIKRRGVKPSQSVILNTHLELMKHLLELNSDYFLILEDDIMILNKFNINEVIKSAPKDWGVIYLGGMNHFTSPHIIDSSFYKSAYSFNAHSYIVKKDFLPTLIKRVEQRDCELDVIFAKMQSNNIGNWYGTIEDYIIQHGRYSHTIITTFKNTTKIKDLKSNIILKQITIPSILSKREIFEDICKKQLKYLDNNYPDIDKKSKLKSVIVESRCGEYIEFTIKNTIKRLGDGWGHILVCTDDNFEYMSNIANDISEEIEIINLGDFKITRDSYNNLCLDINFWNKINCQKVLVYQSDTYIFKDFDDYFLEFDYIGAPWGPSEHSENIKNAYKFKCNVNIGNGGFSLRNLEAMKWCLNEYKPNKNFVNNDTNYMWEDCFFSYYIQNSERYKKTPLKVAQKFSFEHIYSEDTFGCHQPFLDSFVGDNIFGNFLNKIGGVNVLGFGNYLLGLGHNMRVIVDALDKAKIPHNINELKCGSTRVDYLENDTTNYFNTNLILCNPDYDFLSIVGEKYLLNKYNISLWAWELESLPKKWIESSKKFDEIWSQSEFCKESFQNSIPDKKIELINIKGDFRNKNPKEESKKRLGLDGKFIVSFIFDGNSDRVRKNPEGVIYAFNKYLSKFDDCVLFLKCHNLKKDDIEILKKICNEKNILINEGWSDEKMIDLISATDIYTSLHRSEGSGFTIMESIYLGIPTITTNWSGNLDFCKKEFCELVEYEMISLSKDSIYYNENKNGIWANPSYLDAAEKMLNIYNNYEYYLEKSIDGKNFIDDKYDINKLSKFLKNKFKK
jgi:hypothetical protein